MRTAANYIRNTLLNSEQDFRVRLFIVMATAGASISAIMAVGSIIVGNTDIHVWINVATAMLSASLLYYSYKSGNYQRCYFITIVCIFCMLFPALYFTAGGYRSGMPSFFIFAAMFTAFMLRGRQAFGVLLFELVLYSVVFVVSFLYPSTVTPYSDESDSFIAIWGSCILICIVLGLIMLLHFQAYEQQQKDLEKAREEAVKLSQIKSSFLANMSHEIRTPINVILGMNEMVLRDNDSDIIMGHARTIESAGKSLLSLVNNILDVSKIESGKIELYEEEYRLADLIRELTLIGRERADRRGLDFQVEVDEHLPSVLFGDYVHIKQIALNFLSNAAKYTEQGGVTLRIRRQPAANPGRLLLCISVADTGIGIRQEDIGSLFDAFIRADLPSHKDIQGTGLGLAIAKELAVALGGDIQVESRLGVGSEFFLQLEQEVVDGGAISGWQQPAGRPSDRVETFIAPGARILVVDDNKANLLVVKSLLARTMVDIDTTTSSLECIEMLKQDEYHLLLMDYRMPEMDGIQTLAAINREIPGFHTPVVALTAHALAESEQMFLSKGFSAYLTKPIMWSALEGALMELLPSELVIRSQQTTHQLEESTLQQLEQQMRDYGVELEKGLRYLNGDIMQYRRLAGFFLEDYDEALAETERLYAAADWEMLQFTLHSLISKSRMAGAVELSDIATCMEKHCIKSDALFLEGALPVLRLCWQRSTDGLREFAAAMDSLHMAGDGDGPAIDSAAIMNSIRTYRRRDAERMLQAAIASRHPDEDGLRKVLDAVRELDFDEAEVLFAEMEGRL